MEQASDKTEIKSAAPLPHASIFASSTTPASSVYSPDTLVTTEEVKPQPTTSKPLPVPTKAPLDSNTQKPLPTLPSLSSSPPSSATPPRNVLPPKPQTHAPAPSPSPSPSPAPAPAPSPSPAPAPVQSPSKYAQSTPPVSASPILVTQQKKAEVEENWYDVGDEESRKTIQRRREEDRHRVEQKAILERQLNELKIEHEVDLKHREDYDRRRNKDYQSAISNIDLQLTSVNNAMQVEVKELETVVQRLREQYKSSLSTTMAKKARQYAEEDETAIQETKTRRACQDKERRDLCQKRTLELAEQTKEEHANRVRHKEEEELREKASIDAIRQQEDAQRTVKFKNSRAAAVDALNTEYTARLREIEDRHATETKQAEEIAVSTCEEIIKNLQDIESRFKREEAEMRRCRTEHDLLVQEEAEKVNREIEDLHRAEQRVRVFRQREDIERAEAHEQARRDQQDKRLREERARILREQQELENQYT